MKRFSALHILVLITLFLLPGCFAKDQPQGLYQNGKLSPALLEILKITNIDHDGTLPSVVEATQKAWLRKPGTERWEIDNHYETLSSSITPQFKKLGILNEIAPTKKEYTYVAVLGALVPRVRQRLAYALEQWKKGVRFTTLVFLVGARPLEPTKESEEKLYNVDNEFLPFRPGWTKPTTPPKTEAEMARMVFDQAILPEGFKESVKVLFVDTPMQTTANGKLRRPNTADTMKRWLAHEDTQPGSILAISNQPYVHYQDAVLRTLLPKTFTVETVGPKASDKLHIGVILDNIARWLYQENKYRANSAIA